MASALIERTKAFLKVNVALLAIVACGTTVLVLLCCHETLWFDEAYSVGICQHSFAEIWQIGSKDVHPVLYYWFLHIAYLICGVNIIVFRLISAAAVIATAIAGYVLIKKDFGKQAAIAFAVLTFAIPWSFYNGTQIRMYALVCFTVFLSAYYGWRIIQRRRETIPRATWIILTCTTICSAYLHYYGLLAAFLVQLTVLISLVQKSPHRIQNLRTWTICALLAVALYLPWLGAAMAQEGQVSTGFWITLYWPYDILQALAFPFDAPFTISAFVRDNISFVPTYWGPFITLLLPWCVILIAAGFLGYTLFKKKKHFPARYFLLIYFGTLALTLLVSAVMGQLIFYYRYFSVVLACLMLSFAILYALLPQKSLKALLVLALVWMTVTSVPALYQYSFNPQNQEAIEGYEQFCTTYGDSDTLVFADSWNPAAVLAEQNRGPAIHFVDLDNTPAYYAFSPRFVADQDTLALAKSQQKLIFLGNPQNASAFAEKIGAHITQQKSYYHPYSALDFTYSLLER